MRHEPTKARAALAQHVDESFPEHVINVVDWSGEQMDRRVPNFEIIEVAPGPRSNLWTYVTSGAWDAVHKEGHGLEFVLFANASDPRHFELLRMLAWYHAGPAAQQLDLGHTVPIGEPWVEGSSCDHGLISLPYAYGPEFERYRWDDGHVRILAVIPITRVERDFKASRGLEALEQRFEDEGMIFSNPLRLSVI